MLSRRGFLGMFGAAATAGAVGVVAATRVEPDAFTYREYRVRWVGWQRAPNQAVEIGWWMAALPNGSFIASTTGGYVDHYHSEECCILTALKIGDGWPWVTPFTTQAERDALKARALKALKVALDA